MSVLICQGRSWINQGLGKPAFNISLGPYMSDLGYSKYQCSIELIKELLKDDVLIRSYIVNGDCKYEKRLGKDWGIYITEIKLGLFERLWHRLGLGYATYKTVRPNSNSDHKEGMGYDIFSPAAPAENISQLITRYEQLKPPVITPIKLRESVAQNVNNYEKNHSSEETIKTLDPCSGKLEEYTFLNKTNGKYAYQLEGGSPEVAKEMSEFLRETISSNEKDSKNFDLTKTTSEFLVSGKELRPYDSNATLSSKLQKLPEGLSKIEVDGLIPLKRSI